LSLRNWFNIYRQTINFFLKAGSSRRKDYRRP